MSSICSKLNICSTLSFHRQRNQAFEAHFPKSGFRFWNDERKRKKLKSESEDKVVELLVRTIGRTTLNIGSKTFYGTSSTLNFKIKTEESESFEYK